MQPLLALPYEVQIVLLAGYFGYKVTTIGRNVSHRTEDFLLQVLAFGSIGRIAAAGFIQLIAYCRDTPVPLPENIQLVIIAVIALVVTMLVALAWRGGLQSKWIGFMQMIHLYRDDHQGSVLSSIVQEKAVWPSVLVHFDDGRIYESDFHQLSERPLAHICLNDDGIAMYVTKVHREDGTEVDVVHTTDEYGSSINYFPRSNIERIEIAWEKG
ncbi:hypothetical protein [Rhodopseudomonas palustris]|uniref:Uncharacterized protein n=1 Tax=Rhodopseudomonas palustris TaxID=1076 RepID=A0A418VDU3_RHOPL|nr:hypothetical protein [Rhodopseudomonas palustris]RJF74164.1 hypothetical protein D4Q52_13460 [Rhodopseudomonas palustris]